MMKYDDLYFASRYNFFTDCVEWYYLPKTEIKVFLKKWKYVVLVGDHQYVYISVHRHAYFNILRIIWVTTLTIRYLCCSYFFHARLQHIDDNVYWIMCHRMGGVITPYGSDKSYIHDYYHVYFYVQLYRLSFQQYPVLYIASTYSC